MAVPVGLTPVTAAAATGGLGRPDLPEQRVSKVKEVRGPGAKEARARVAAERKANKAQADRAHDERKSSAWPKPASAKVALRPGTTAKAAPGGLPVTVAPGKDKGAERPAASTATATATVTVLDQKAAGRLGITGVVLTAAAENAGQAQLSIDYGAFASALGGGWSSRLQLVQLPACALTTPEKSECRTRTPLASQNDTDKQTVSATVALPETTTGLTPQLATAATAESSSATVLAVTATGDPGSGEAANGAGDYSATPLSESSSWQAGASSGAFTWSYDFTMPPAAAGPAPSLSLSYDSGSVDGRTATTNNQGSAVGEGFSITESYIERSYGSCDDDGHADVFDRCWKYDNASLVLNGKSTRLVKDDTTGVWRLQGDDDSKVIRSTGADNGDNDGEYWTVITGDGTRYVFGLNKLDGATTQRTNSTWTVPVFGDDSGEPGYSAGSTFADRSLTQAWRWNLDYVEDTSGNAATYWYTKETNHYKKNKATTANASYTRGGYLTEIKYGLRKGALFTDDADAKVTFSHAERCTVADCSSLTKDTADNWPDVPFDAICASGATECRSAGPTFFSRKRLTGVNTFSWSASTATYQPVDSWTFTQQYLDGGDIGDTSDHVLTLKSLQRTAKAGTAISTPPIGFTYQLRPNRVDGTDDILPLTRPRVSTVTSETGAITTVTMSAAECVRSEVLGAAEDTNTRNCFPQYWNINGASDASIDWFHKYRVVAVTTSDPAGQNDVVEHEYAYSGAAWHHSDEPFTPKDERTWSDWRGYRQVTVYTGAKTTTRSKTVSVYMQGMDGDKLKNGTTRSVTVAPLSSPSLGLASLKDSDQYAGQLRQQVTYDGATAISAEAHEPWSQETARQSVPDASARVAGFVRVRKSTHYTYLTVPQSWRARTTVVDYDGHGMPYQVEGRGDDAKSGDETCTRTWYARNTAIGITNPVSRTRVVGKTCAVADTSLDLPTDSTRRGDVLSDVATAYDGATWSLSMTPTKGLATWTGRAKSYTSTGAVAWQTLGTTTYDTLGRPLTVTDAAGKTTSTAYSPATAGPLTRTIVTNPKGHRTASFIDPRRGQAQRTYDANLKKTELAYDSLGRLTDVWLPNREKGGGQSPNLKFRYNVSATQPSWVSSSTLKADGETYNTTYAIYDSLLRKLQDQVPSAHTGRVLTDTRYDSRGLAYETFADIFDNTSTPNGTYTRAEFGEAPKQTQTVYDGAGRATRNTFVVFGVEKWSTTTAYTGDSTATTAVQGANATRGIIDARGRTVETRTYAGDNPADTAYGAMTGVPYTSVKFTHTLDDKKLTVTGPDGAKWTRSYDIFGRLATDTDPDKGTSRSEYDAADRVIKATDARGTSLLTEYDELGRTLGTWSGTKTDANQLTSFTYDTLLKGYVDSSTRYIGGKTGQAYTKAVAAYDTLNRPTSTQLKLPTTDPLVQAGTPATIDMNSTYRIDGTPETSTAPTLGGLPKETISYGYNSAGLIKSVTGTTGYLLDVDYSAIGQVQQLVLGTGNTEAFKKTYVSNTYEEGTGRLLRSHVTDQTHPYMLQDLTYSYDQAGNVRSIADPTTLGGTATPETQCFTYDGHRRMTEAWTPTSQNCADARSASTLSGPAPYWTSYTYNTAGQRATETQHKSSGDATTTYCYKGAQPHTLTGTSTAGNCTTPERSYTYDPSGNTKTRPGPQTTQSLDWTPEGKLARLAEGTKATDYIYDADGELLIRSTSSGERILYVGATELHRRANGTTWAQRTYTAGETRIAVRTNETGSEKLHYLAGDHHGTSTLAIGADATQPFVKRHMTPFGAPRGSGTSTWPDDKAFLGKTADKGTGLTHVGARQYDPLNGQFLSVDPLLELDKHQTLNGYSYGSQNPATFSDPSGLGLACGTRDDQEACPTNPSGGKQGQPSKVRGAGDSGGGGKSGTSSTDQTGIVIVLAETPNEVPRKYLYQAPNGVCIWAAASTCQSPNTGSSVTEIEDLPCPSGDPQWVCSARNALYKFGISTGMTGGSLGFFGLRPGMRYNQARGIPEGFTAAQMEKIRQVFKGRLAIESNIVVQGSRVTGNIHSKSDVDIAVRVTPETFDALIAKRWPNPPNPGSSNASTRAHAIEVGKLTAGDVRPRLSPFRGEVEKILGDTVDHVDVSVIRMGGPFDRGPFIDIANN
ncbi:RHS repeat-associated core domain-containing protein [Streptomyces sp. TRM64462]|uniref:RHS repeat-associated core domain-containing protein n=1 Tax=Streptomyces sp. TRM64462 TaxID=2741726 RepID=UPI0020C7CD72|nr:RHS repeat-associated core domain-containing protein [Streptomyces sp. TRM64462]